MDDFDMLARVIMSIPSIPAAAAKALGAARRWKDVRIRRAWQMKSYFGRAASNKM